MDELDEQAGLIYGQRLPVAPVITHLSLEAMETALITLAADLVCGEKTVRVTLSQSLDDPEGVGIATVGPRPAGFDSIHFFIGEWLDLPPQPLVPLRLMMHRALRVAELMYEAEGESGLRSVEAELRARLAEFAGSDR